VWLLTALFQDADLLILPIVKLKSSFDQDLHSTQMCVSRGAMNTNHRVSVGSRYSHKRHSDKFYLLTSVFVEYDERVEVGGKAS
jgi:hypothetical protein